MDLLMLKEALSDVDLIVEALRLQRQDLRIRPARFKKQHPHRKFERRATRDAGTKRRVKKTAYNAGQRDRYKNSRTAKKSDGTKGKIKPRRKAMGSVIRPRRSLRTRIR